VNNLQKMVVTSHSFLQQEKCKSVTTALVTTNVLAAFWTIKHTYQTSKLRSQVQFSTQRTATLT